MEKAVLRLSSIMNQWKDKIGNLSGYFPNQISQGWSSDLKEEYSLLPSGGSERHSKKYAYLVLSRDNPLANNILIWTGYILISLKNGPWRPFKSYIIKSDTINFTHIQKCFAKIKVITGWNHLLIAKEEPQSWLT
jgi:hypothetical protein